ncbi:hypothetical protein DIZ27_32465 [Streptomyces sp. NWU339]|nr:hypothetical protein DIZ27_32465 [Streptomyces sp. NWU339]
MCHVGTLNRARLGPSPRRAQQGARSSIPRSGRGRSRALRTDPATQLLRALLVLTNLEVNR